MVVAAIAIALRAYIGHSQTESMEHKSARTTSGIITDKKYVQFGSNQTEYQNDEGQIIHLEDWRRKSGEFRIFYKIDNFDQIPEIHRSTIVTVEEQRTKQHGFRYRVVDQRTFDQANIGQVVKITYRWASDSKTEIISFELVK